MADLFPTIIAQRLVLAAELEVLSDAQWHQPSLVRGWEISHVASHLVWSLEKSTAGLAWDILRAAGSFSRAIDNAAARETRTAPQVASSLRANAQDRRVYPGVGPAGILMDTLVHCLDIRVPLGLPSNFPADAVNIVLRRLSKARSKRFFGTPGGFTFCAQDVGWQAGAGPRVEGSGVDMLLVMTGRTQVVPRLTGDGAASFGQRFGGYP